MFITNMIKVAGCVMMLFHASLDAAGRAGIPHHPARLRGRRPRRGGLLAGEVRHPHRAPAAAAARRRERLDRRAHRRLDHPRHAASAARSSATPCPARCSASTCRASTPASTRAGEAAIAIILFVYVIAAVFNLYIPDTGVDHHAPKQEPGLPDPRLRALLPPALARQARTDLARDDDALLGRRRDAAVHRAQVGASRRSTTRSRKATALQGISAVGIAVGAVVAGAFRPAAGARSDVLPVGIAMGLLVIVMNFVRDLWVAIPLMVADRRARRVLRRADERAAAAPRPHPDGRRALDRGAELQREPLDPGHAGALRQHDQGRPLDLHDHRVLRPLRERLDGARAPPAPATTSARRTRCT